MTRITTFAIALFITVSSFAKPVDIVNGEIRTAFSKSFHNAQVLSAEKHEAFTKLTFKMNDAVMFAFYSNTGELLAVTRNIVSTQLPMNLLLSLKEEYKGYWITDLFEFNGNDSGTNYYATLENADVKITLRSNGDSWEIYTSAQK